METKLKEYHNSLNDQKFSILEKELLNDLELCDYATTRVTNDFPVADIVFLVYESSFQPNKNVKDKIELLREFFTLIFNYSKNLLTKFDIYPDISIKENSPKFNNCLLKIPNYSKYLECLGYKRESNVWTYSKQNKLSDEMTHRLLCVTICCCVGSGVYTRPEIINDIKIFEVKKTELKNIFQINSCSNCQSRYNESNLKCDACNETIWSDNFYQIWNNPKYDSNKSLKNEPYQFYFPENHDTHIGDSEEYVDYQYENTSINNNTSSMSHHNQHNWICEFCNLKNDSKKINCESCNKTPSNLKYNHNNLSSPNDLIDLNKQKWSCKTCTFLNDESKYICETCGEKDENRFILINEQEDVGKWSCKKCALLNNKNTFICEACDEIDEYRFTLINNEQDDNTWSCKKCTFLNYKNKFICEACNERDE